jgi:hypothetical protein
MLRDRLSPRGFVLKLCRSKKGQRLVCQFDPDAQVTGPGEQATQSTDLGRVSLVLNGI